MRLRLGEVALRADELVLDRRAGVAEARGDVVLVRRSAVFTGASARLELADLTGQLHQARLLLRRGDPPTPWPPPDSFAEVPDMPAVVEVCGETIEKVDEDRLLVRQGVFTPCRCPGGETPSWRFEAVRAEAEIGESALLTLPVFYIQETPLLYLPALSLPLSERRSGLLWPRFAYVPRVGWALGQSAYWAPREDLDLTLEADLYTERGIREGLEFRYALTEDFRGRWYGTYLYDWAIEDESATHPHWTEVHRFTLEITHRQRILDQARLGLRVELVGDPDTQAIFADSLARRENEFNESNLLLVRELDEVFLGLDASVFQDLRADGPLFGSHTDSWTLFSPDRSEQTRAPSDATVHRLPRLVTWILPRRLGVLPLALSARAEFANRLRLGPAVVSEVARRPDGQELPILPTWPMYELWRPGEVRADRRLLVLGDLAVPLAFGDGAVELTPAARLAQVLTLRDGTRQGWEEQGYCELGARLGAMAYRVFPAGPADRYKHELEPFVRYSFRPAMWEGGDTGVAGLLLDRFDRPEPRHRVQLGLANRLIGAHSADPGSETRYRRVLDLEVTQALDLEPLAGEDEVGPTRFELEGALGPLTLDLDLGVDPTAPRLQEVLGRAGLDWPAGFSLLLEYDYLREGAGYRFGRGRNPGRIHELLLSPAVRLFDSVQLRYLLRYRLADEVLLATGAYLRYASPCGCWSLSLKALALPAEAVPRVYIVVDLSRLGSFGN